MAIATAAKQIIVDRMDIVVAGGVESISLVQTDALRVDEDPDLVALPGDAYIAMIHTRSEEPPPELQSLIRAPSAFFCSPSRHQIEITHVQISDTTANTPCRSLISPNRHKTK